MCSSSDLFIATMCHIFNHAVYGGVVGSCLFHLRHGKHSVAEYIIEFCTLAAENCWDAKALMMVFQQGLSNALKNELVSQDVPESLEEPIERDLKLDNHL